MYWLQQFCSGLTLGSAFRNSALLAVFGDQCSYTDQSNLSCMQDKHLILELSLSRPWIREREIQK